ncbi:MAG: hypothetical protein KKF44_03640 [Nanoarchaeota archaeon]|nr:hypothetical protein [Nanoarchaeota archaeon]
MRITISGKANEFVNGCSSNYCTIHGRSFPFGKMCPQCRMDDVERKSTWLF